MLVAKTPGTGPQQGDVVVLSPDAAFIETIRRVFGASGKLAIRTGGHVSDASVDVTGAGVVIVDLDARQHADLVALQGLMGRIAGRAPVIVVTEAFDEAVARWLIQIRVADFMRKPVDPMELARACVKAMRSQQAAPPPKEAEICTFLPAAGGVGTTTLAIQTAMLLLGENKTEKGSVCVVDLDFQTGACAFHLDIEPRLDLDAIGPDPARLDRQLLEVMLTRHSSGLTMLAAPNRPAELRIPQSTLVFRLLDLLAEQFDYLVLDMPRTWFDYTNTVLSGSNRLFVVTETTVPGIKLAANLSTAIRAKLGDDINPRVIVNRFEKRMFGAGLKRSDLEVALKQAFAGTVANSYKVVREAIDRGVPIQAIEANNPVSADLRTILTAEKVLA
jgi:pilus assembly protein CpaE